MPIDEELQGTEKVWTAAVEKLVNLLVAEGVEVSSVSGYVPDDGLPVVEAPASDVFEATVKAIKRFCNTSRSIGGVAQASKQRLGIVGHESILIATVGAIVTTDGRDHFGSLKEYKRLVKEHTRFFGNPPTHELKQCLLIEGDGMQFWIENSPGGMGLNKCINQLRAIGVTGCQPHQTLDTLKRSERRFRIASPHAKHVGVIIDADDAAYVIDQMAVEADAREVICDDLRIQTVEADRDSAARLVSQGRVELWTSYGRITMFTTEALELLNPATEQRELFGHTVAVVADELHEPFKQLAKVTSPLNRKVMRLSANTTGNTDPEWIMQTLGGLQTATPSTAQR